MTVTTTIAAPVITGATASLTTVSQSPLALFAGTGIADSNSGATDTVTITLSGSGGTLSDGVGFSGLVVNTNGSYSLSGSAAAVTGELDALVFTPNAGAAGTSSVTTFALSDTAALPSYGTGPLLTRATFNNINGAYASAGVLVNAAGNVFGVTQYGGANGDGAVFALFKASGYATVVPVATFTGANGANPQGTLVADAAGDLFGTTSSGGASGDGTVFEIIKGTMWSAPVTLATFSGTNGSNAIDGLLIDAAGNLFGTTNNGGSSDYGTVFEIAKGTNGYGALTTLASFSGANGEYPRGLTMDAAGNLFGETIQGGGTNVLGTVFELVKGSSGYGAPVTLAAFNSALGANPRGGLLIDAAGNLFGETSAGGTNSDGTVFELVKGASGYGAPVTLATFDGVNQITPRGGLVADAGGDLFGTTYNGGPANDGSVFEMVKTGSGYAAPVTLLTFNGTNGAFPDATLSFDAAGDLFGTTFQGGANNLGTVFELTAGQITQSSAVVTVSVTNQDPIAAPAALMNNAAPVYQLGGAAVAIAPAIALTDPGVASLQSASVAITTGFRAGDQLNFANQNGITGSYNAATGVLALSGTATIAAYQAALASVTYASGAQDPTGANTDITRGLTLTVNNGTAASGAQAITLTLNKPAGVTYTLTKTAVTINGGAGDDMFNASTGTLLAADVIQGGIGTNTLDLIGGGTFNLGTPKTLSQIEVVNLSESQTATQSVTLRAQLNADVYVASGTAAAGNTAPEAITITGVAGDSSTIHLGQGSDTVTLGSATEAVIGTGGTANVKATAATAGAMIAETGGTVSLTLSNGGSATLNVADSGIKSVILSAATTAWSFVTDTEAKVVINDKSTTADQINLLGASATVTLGTGASTVDIHAKPGKDILSGFVAGGTAHDTLQIDSSVFADWAHLLGATKQQGSDLLITIDSADSVLLKNVALSAFTASDVKFA